MLKADATGGVAARPGVLSQPMLCGAMLERQRLSLADMTENDVRDIISSRFAAAVYGA